MLLLLLLLLLFFFVVVIPFGVNLVDIVAARATATEVEQAAPDGATAGIGIARAPAALESPIRGF